MTKPDQYAVVRLKKRRTKEKSYMEKAVGNMSIEAARTGFEASFEEADFYNKQTQDEKHLKDILATINVKTGMKILDLGCGSGYLTFPIAKGNENVYVVGLDIVTDTLERNTISMRY